ncbi:MULTISPECIES: DUF7210 family protein [unclassified Pseudomonas]|uniref:DUF7210 family protein n=1 Tax=unclassified Pseudomonas TaxID=196821 RepID=UPI001C610A78|nr:MULTISPECIES: hypothetical protein [unclassified Pseudomonas]MBW5416112.1 hypothetical protein [Pseudomonas sp. MAG002Y]
MTAKSRAADAADLVQVTLKNPHKHAGVQYQAGDKIKVTEAEKEWLTKFGVIGAKANAPEPDTSTEMGAQSNG